MARCIGKRYTEYFIYLIFWGVLLLSPFFGALLKDITFWPTKEEMLSFWEFLLPALILFFLNNNILMPFLLYKKRGRLFVLYLLCVIVACSIIFISFPVEKPPKPQFGLGVGIPPVMTVDSPVGEVGDIVPFPWEMPISDDAPKFFHGHPGVWMFFVDPRNVQVLITLFVLVFNICIRLFFFTIRRDEHFKELEKEKLRSNLEYLRYQINPHFFMNTLNNIHALIDVDKEKAQKTVYEFSRMMRYVLYDTSATSVPLEKEISFLSGYIDLMRLRYTDKLEVVASFEPDAGGVFVPPMLFMQFVENAFKHGVTYKKKSFIDVALRLDEVDNAVVFTCSNTVPDEPASPFMQEHGGVGIENARKRLHLLYGDSAKLIITCRENRYNVVLKIPMNYDKVLDN